MEKGKRPDGRSICFGAAVSMGAYLLLLMLAAYLTLSGRVDEALSGRTVWLCACIAAFAGAVTAARKRRSGTAALLCAGIFGGSLLLIGFLTQDALEPYGAGAMLAAVAAGALLSLLLLRRKSERKGKRRKAVRARR